MNFDRDVCSKNYLLYVYIGKLEKPHGYIRNTFNLSFHLYQFNYIIEDK